jgi:hypothetical protein
MASKIEVGDRVGYRVRWLRSTGMEHSDLARARGVVTAIRERGPNGWRLATIDWNDEDIPAKVLVANLAKPGTLAFTSEDRW